MVPHLCIHTPGCHRSECLTPGCHTARTEPLVLRLKSSQAAWCGGRVSLSAHTEQKCREGVLVTIHRGVWHRDREGCFRGSSSPAAAQGCDPSILGQSVTLAAALPNDLHSTNISHKHKHLGHLTAATCKHPCKTSAILDSSKTTKWKLSVFWTVFAL